MAAVQEEGWLHLEPTLTVSEEDELVEREREREKGGRAGTHEEGAGADSRSG